MAESPETSSNTPQVAAEPASEPEPRPLLRLWGFYKSSLPVFWDSSAECWTKVYSVMIHKHDRIHGMDLSKTEWHRSCANEVLHYRPFPSLLEVSRHANIRLDKFSDAGYDWPIRTVLHHEVESELWIPIEVLLFDKERRTKLEEAPYREGCCIRLHHVVDSGDPETVCCIPDDSIRQAIAKYLGKYRPANKATEDDTAGKQSTVTPSAVVRGRQRRQFRRHGVSHGRRDHNFAFSHDVSRSSTAEYESVLRGRPRKQYRRDLVYDRDHRVPHNPSFKEAESTKPAGNLDTDDTESDHYVSIAELLPKYLKEIPTLIVGNHDMLVENECAPPECSPLPPMSEGPGALPHPVGCLVTLRGNLISGKSAAYSGLLGPFSFVNWKHISDPGQTAPEEYWHKFYPEYFVTLILLKYELQLIQLYYYRSPGVFRNSIKTPWIDSYKAWRSPDESLGPLLECISLDSDWRPPRLDPLDDFSEKHNDQVPQKTPIIDCPVEPVVATMEETEIRYYHVPQGIRTKRSIQARRRPMRGRKRVLFYDMMDAPDIKPFTDESIEANYGSLILSIAHNEEYGYDVRAQALFQFGLCFLSGFGTEKNISAGVAWIFEAARKGNYNAKGLLERLHAAYSLEISSTDRDTAAQWTLEEALRGSGIAIETLRETSREGDESRSTTARLQNNLGHLEDIWRLVFGHLDSHPEDVCCPDSIISKLLPEYEIMEGGRGNNETSRAALEWASAHCFSGNLLNLLRSAPYQEYSNSPDWIPEMISAALYSDRAENVHALLDFAESAFLFGHQKSSWLEESCMFEMVHISDSAIEPVAQRLIGHGLRVNMKFAVKPADRYAPGPRGLDRSSYGFEVRGRSVTLLRWAIIHNRIELVRVLLENGAVFPLVEGNQANAPDRREALPAKWATVHTLEEPCCDIDILGMFLQRHGSGSDRAAFEDTPLGLIVTEPESPRRRIRLGRRAAPENLFPIIDLLLSHQPNSHANTMWAAIKNGHIDIVLHLLHSNVSVELRYQGLTPLHTAVLYGDRDAFALLLDYGADPFAVTSQKGISAIHLNFWRPKSEQTELFILNKLHELVGNISDALGPFGEVVSPLHLAVINSRQRGLERLLELGLEPRATLRIDIMPTWRGAHCGWEFFKDWAEWENQQDPSVEKLPVKTPLDGLTPMGILFARDDMMTTQFKHTAIRLILTSVSRDRLTLGHFYTRPSLGQTVLHMLSREDPENDNGCKDMMSPAELIDLGASVAGLHINVQDNDGDTPLHYASALRPERRVVSRLCTLGADKTIRNKYDLTPMTLWMHNDLREFECTETGRYETSSQKSIYRPISHYSDDTSRRVDTHYYRTTPDLESLANDEELSEATLWTGLQNNDTVYSDIINLRSGETIEDRICDGIQDSDSRSEGFYDDEESIRSQPWAADLVAVVIVRRPPPPTPDNT